jgi:hypothetical protein
MTSGIDAKRPEEGVCPCGAALKFERSSASEVSGSHFFICGAGHEWELWSNFLSLIERWRYVGVVARPR